MIHNRTCKIGRITVIRFFSSIFIFSESNSPCLVQPVLFLWMFGECVFFHIHVQSSIKLLSLALTFYRYNFREYNQYGATNASDYSYIIISIIVIGYFYKLCYKHIFITKALAGGISRVFFSFRFWLCAHSRFEMGTNLTMAELQPIVFILKRLTISI